MSSGKGKDALYITLNVLKVLFILWLFLLGIELLGASLKGFGKGFADMLIKTTSNPFVGLFIGIVSTAIIQSSSATTSMVVGSVAAGIINVPNAVPIIMGANIGTSITNVLVSFTHITRKVEFARAFPSAVVHDFFNILSVLIFFPLELMFHPIQKSSFLLTKIFSGGKVGATFHSPLKIVVEPGVKLFLFITHKHYVILLIIAFVIIVYALKLFVDIIRKFATEKFELIIDKYLFKNDGYAFLIGLLLTSIVQSSSVTTSIVVPLAGAGLLDIIRIFPYTLGANVGTTLTALMASLVTGSIASVQVAFCHLTFNIFGILVWYPLKVVPITLAKKFGHLVSEKKYLAIVYVVVIFFIVPLLTIFISRR